MSTAKKDYKLVFPEHIKIDRPLLNKFLEVYFEWIQSKNNPYNISNHFIENTKVDTCDDEYLDRIKDKFGAKLPKNIKADKRKLLKNIVDIYLAKGTPNSFAAMFNMIYGEEIEIIYPRDYILKPSDGKWSKDLNIWIDEDGLLDSLRYIQDSYYYQVYSYVIKSGVNPSEWLPIIKGQLHPSGFIAFGSLLINSFADARIKVPIGNSIENKGLLGILVMNEKPVYAGEISNKWFYIIRAYYYTNREDIIRTSMHRTWWGIEREKFTIPEAIWRYLDEKLIDVIGVPEEETYKKFNLRKYIMAASDGKWNNRFNLWTTEDGLLDGLATIQDSYYHKIFLEDNNENLIKAKTNISTESEIKVNGVVNNPLENNDFS